MDQNEIVRYAMDYYFCGRGIDAVGACWLWRRRPNAGSCRTEGNANPCASDRDAYAFAAWGNPGSDGDSYAEAGSSGARPRRNL